MEYAPGGDLASYLKAVERLEVKEARRYFAETVRLSCGYLLCRKTVQEGRGLYQGFGGAKGRGLQAGSWEKEGLRRAGQEGRKAGQEGRRQ